jgi:pimeloyl-ACP methyl ester carboxylesterase
MEEQSRLVAETMARLDVKRATVVGHSLGGRVAVALTQQSPDLVERLVIMDTAPDNNHGGIGLLARLGYIPVIGQAVWKVKTRFTVKKGLEQAFAPGYDVPDQFIDDVERMTYSAYDRSHADSDSYTEQEPLDQRLGTSPPPLLVIFGTEDQFYDVPEAPDAYRDVPGAKVELVEGAGHSPNVEKPLQTARLILDFIASARPASPTQQDDQRSKKRRERDARRDGERAGRNGR